MRTHFTSGPRSTLALLVLGLPLLSCAKSEEAAVVECYNDLRRCRDLATAGDGLTQSILGRTYYEGQQLLGISRDMNEAAHWLQLAAVQRRPEAQVLLGRMYLAGEGVPRDEAEAAMLFRGAALQGDGEGQRRLGEMYFVGAGVVKDDVEAVDWFRLASAQGDAIAQARLGTMYWGGWGVPENDERAYFWLSLGGAQAGSEHPEWIGRRDEAASRLTPERRAAVQDLAAACQASGFEDCDEPAN